jgi:hypothetical protein
MLMRKRYYKILCWLILALFNRHGQAQIRLGITAGSTISGVSQVSSGSFGGGTGTNYDSRRPYYGYYAGIVANYNLGPNFVLRPMLNWVQAGWNTDVVFGDDGKVGWIKKYRINDIELPIGAFYTTQVGAGKMYIGGGPYLSCAINGKFSPGLNFNVSTSVGDNFHDIIVGGNTVDQYILHVKRMNYGLSAAVGYELNAGIFIHLAFDYGLSGITRSDFYDKDAKTRLFRLGIGYLLNRRR